MVGGGRVIRSGLHSCVVWFLVGNLGFGITVDRGRGRHWGFKSLAQRMGAYNIVSDVNVKVRYIEAHRNVADEGSRRFERIAVAEVDGNFIPHGDEVVCDDMIDVVVSCIRICGVHVDLRCFFFVPSCNRCPIFPSDAMCIQSAFATVSGPHPSARIQGVNHNFMSCLFDGRDVRVHLGDLVIHREGRVAFELFSGTSRFISTMVSEGSRLLPGVGIVDAICFDFSRRFDQLCM